MVFFTMEIIIRVRRNVLKERNKCISYHRQKYNSYNRTYLIFLDNANLIIENFLSSSKWYSYNRKIP